MAHEFKLTPNQLAEELGVSAKRIRSVMRKLTTKDQQPGSGGRWDITTTEFADKIRAEIKSVSNRKVSEV